MYIKKVVIEKIRSIDHLEMDFGDVLAGWHVIIGDNGAGKSSVIRSIAATLIGPEQIGGVLPIWSEWLNDKSNTAKIELQILPDWKYDTIGKGQPPQNKTIINKFELKRDDKNFVSFSTNSAEKPLPPTNYNWSNNQGWFSVAYGPFRRFTGGEEKRNKVFYAFPKAGAHLSAFGEEVALTEALDWLKELDRKRLKQNEQNNQSMVQESSGIYKNESELIFGKLQSFINNSGLLPHGALFESVNIDGEIIFKDGNGTDVKVTQMSDGYRSILSLMFELLRQLISTYGIEKVFEKKGKYEIVVAPGIVLIDEIDAHLHPTWQTRIGQWFTNYFPNIQFIVTSHSPLVCRASEKGSIWRLAAPGSELKSGKVTGTDRQRLIYGNVLDAYGTEIFGEDVSQSEKGIELQKELADLNKEAFKGRLNEDGKKRMDEIKKILPTAL